MTNEEPAMSLKAIGTVRNNIKEPQPHRHDYHDIVSDIIIDSNLTEALDGLDEFSHIIVLYWMHLAASKKIETKIHPRRNPELPLMGLFATRTPVRPNPIGESTVKLLQRQKNILKVQGLDAINGTPVIDIKPYIPGSDLVADAKVPRWIAQQ